MADRLVVVALLAGFGCSSSTTLEGDGSDGSDVRPDADCPAAEYDVGANAMGAPCETAVDCRMGPPVLPAECLTAFVTSRGEYPAEGGYCTSGFSCVIDEGCGTHGSCAGMALEPDGRAGEGIGCVAFPHPGQPKCVRLCHTVADCRDGYSCLPVPPFVGYRACLPDGLEW